MDYCEECRLLETLGIDSPTNFTEKAYYEAVGGMENEDGTKGPHWQVKEVEEIVKKENIELGEFNIYDYAFALNMVYSDYFGAIPDKDESYIKVANAWIFDKDAIKGKALVYWLAMKGMLRRY